jgi:hypothetical protein
MNTQEIKRGEYNAYYPISELKMATVNRETVNKHAENFKSKLNDFGWMMPVVISSRGDVIEGHHRIESAKLLNQKTVPAYIVNWINTDKEAEHLKAIISLNNGNKAWNTLNYLKAYSTDSEDYNIVYKSYLSNQNNISVGNVVNCFFGLKSKSFKNGDCNIIDYDFSIYLIGKISKLVSNYGKANVQAYCVREMIKFAFEKDVYKDYDALNFLFKEYAKLVKSESPAATSISRFKPLMESLLTEFKTLRNANNKRR